MNYTGIVTSYVLDYCAFTLDNRLVVYAGYLFASCNDILMPDLHETAIIENGEFINNSLYLHSASKIYCNKFLRKKQVEICDLYVKLIKENKLQSTEMHIILKIDKLLQDFFNISEEKATIRNLVFSIFINLCSENGIKKNIITPNQLKLDQCATKVESNIHWSFGVNHVKNNEYIIGILSVSPKLGFLVLSDKKYFIVCVISSNTRVNYSKKLSKLLNNFVIIKNYRIFYENVKEHGLYHYLDINIDDIYLLDSGKSSIKNELNTKFALRLKVINRAAVTIKQQKLWCWVHCAIETNGKFKECMIQLHENLFFSYPIVNRGDEFILRFNSLYFQKQIQNFSSGKVYKLNGESLPVFLLSMPASLELVENNLCECVSSILDDFELLSVFEASKLLNVSTEKNKFADLVSFKAIVDDKRFCDPFKVENKSKSCGFGTPGDQVHQIILIDHLENGKTSQNQSNNTEQYDMKIYSKDHQYCDDYIFDKFNKMCNQYNKQWRFNKLEISLYIHQWEEMQMPLGLIPGMLIEVHNVLPYKFYFKTSFVTNFKILNYIPKFKFNTCYELIGNEFWGPEHKLGGGEGIPANCICWGSTITIKISHCSFNLVCKNCSKTIPFKKKKCCSNVKPKLDICFGLIIRDSEGIADVVSKDPETLRVLLGFRKDEWKVFTVSMKFMRKFSFSVSSVTDLYELDITEDQRKWYEMFLCIIESYNRQGIHRFDLKCRKMYKKALDKNPKWFLLEARPSNLSNNPIFLA